MPYILYNNSNHLRRNGGKCGEVISYVLVFQRLHPKPRSAGLSIPNFYLFGCATVHSVLRSKKVDHSGNGKVTFLLLKHLRVYHIDVQ